MSKDYEYFDFSNILDDLNELAGIIVEKDNEKLTYFLFLFVDESEMRSPASVDSSTSCTSSNNAASTNELATTLPEWMIEGERILLRKSNLSGTIAYIGPIEFASGTWIGIELDVPVGKESSILPN